MFCKNFSCSCNLGQTSLSFRPKKNWWEWKKSSLSGAMSKESLSVISSYGIVPFHDDRYSRTHFFPLAYTIKIFYKALDRSRENFHIPWRRHFFSSSVKLLAKVPRLCWKYFIVLTKWNWFPMLAKLMFEVFFPAMFISRVIHMPDLKPFSKKKKWNLNKLCAITGVLQ